MQQDSLFSVLLLSDQSPLQSSNQVAMSVVLVKATFMKGNQ
jgi:hypothetical protein